ncbi:hypothetical protein Bbelb_393140 [Branchiostoma belcheri]|nr:hypothetical protein Bbelb_393140 [Branchiostoma belcheri]
MGLSDGSVPSSQLSASSSIDLFPPGNGRVNFTTGGITGWIPDSEEWLKFDTTAESDVFTLMDDEEPPYLEADFGSPQELTGVITQGGGGGDMYVTKSPYPTATMGPTGRMYWKKMARQQRYL